MSNSYGAVRFQDGLILHFEYQGTSDVCYPVLRDTVEEVYNHWRSGEWHYHSKDCNKQEDVEIASTYGGGFSWKGKACRHCKLITDRLTPHDDNLTDEENGYNNDLPEWYPDRKDYLL